VVEGRSSGERLTVRRWTHVQNVTDKEGHYIFNPKVAIEDPKGVHCKSIDTFSWQAMTLSLISRSLT